MKDIITSQHFKKLRRQTISEEDNIVNAWLVDISEKYKQGVDCFILPSGLMPDTTIKILESRGFCVEQTNKPWGKIKLSIKY